MEDTLETLSIDRRHPRRILQKLLLSGNIEQLLELAGMLHGHYCPGLTLGVKAVEAAFGRLGITDNTGMEEIMAVIEGNSCMADGIQFASGCTLGNNALAYKDLGSPQPADPAEVGLGKGMGAHSVIVR